MPLAPLYGRIGSDKNAILTPSPLVLDTISIGVVAPAAVLTIFNNLNVVIERLL